MTSYRSAGKYILVFFKLGFLVADFFLSFSLSLNNQQLRIYCGLLGRSVQLVCLVESGLIWSDLV